MKSLNHIEKAEKLLDIVLSAQQAVALTGAGISTESGIPDYRSPDTGLWENMDKSVVSLDGFLHNPSNYYAYALELYPVRKSAKPNKAHKLLANLEKKGYLKGIITQNVDGLHQEAESEIVHELHGSLRQAVCLECTTLFPMENIMERVKVGENPPLCEHCGGLLKPNAIFFGETLPQVPWIESVKLCRNADLLIVIGSSLQVSPANILPDTVLKSGGSIIIINLQPTPFDADATLVIRDKVGEFAGSVMELLK